MAASTVSLDTKFDGSNWHVLGRVVTISRFQFAQNDDFDNDAPRQCKYLCLQFSGPALDWAGTALAVNPEWFDDFDTFVDRVREAFGVADNNITALLRRDLDQLRWTGDVPTFFAEFDRITTGLSVTSHETRVAMVESKLPMSMKVRLAEQALSFSNYETMRERFNCMWAMDPTRGQATGSRARPRCGNCKKKGHTAAECRAK
jgi:hypothetical protein